MKIIKKIASVAAISAILSSTVFADTVAIGPKIGTQGIGIEGRIPMTENGFVRMGVNYVKLEHDTRLKDFGSEVFSDLGTPNLLTPYDVDIKLKGKLTLLTAPIMFDYHPFDNSGFRVSAGIAYNGNKVDIKGSVVPTLNGVTIQSYNGLPVSSVVDSLIGTVKGKIKLGSAVSGLLTLGYDSSFISQSPFSFNFEAGAMFTGKPKLTISTTGPVLGTEDVRAYLQRKANEKFKTIDKYLQVFPVISLGVKYTF